MELKNKKQSNKKLIIALVAILAVAAVAYMGTKFIEGGYLQGSLKNLSIEKQAIDTSIRKQPVINKTETVRKFNDSIKGANKRALLDAAKEVATIAETDSEAAYAAAQIEKIYTIPVDTETAVILNDIAQEYTISETSLVTNADVSTYEVSQEITSAVSTDTATAYVGEIVLNEPVSLGEVRYYLPSEEVLKMEFEVVYADGTKSSIIGQPLSADVYSFKNPTNKEIINAAFVDYGYDASLFDASKLVYAADSAGNVLYFEEAVSQ